MSKQIAHYILVHDTSASIVDEKLIEWDLNDDFLLYPERAAAFQARAHFAGRINDKYSLFVRVGGARK